MTAQRQTWAGFEQSLTRGAELVLTPLVFGVAGHGLDRLLGTGWVLAILLGAVAVVALFLRAYYRYSAEMARHEAAVLGPKRPSAADLLERAR